MAVLGEVFVEGFRGVEFLLAVHASSEVHLTADVVDQLHLLVKVEFQSISDVLEKQEKRKSNLRSLNFEKMLTT